MSSSVKKVESSLTASVKKLETTANDTLALISPRILITKAEEALKLKGLDVWWMRSRKDREAYKALPNKDLDIMIVEGAIRLSSLSLVMNVFIDLLVSSQHACSLLLTRGRIWECPKGYTQDIRSLDFLLARSRRVPCRTIHNIGCFTR